MRPLTPRRVALSRYAMALVLVGASACGAESARRDSVADAAAGDIAVMDGPVVDARGAPHDTPASPDLSRPLEDRPTSVDAARSSEVPAPSDAAEEPTVRFTSPREGETVTGVVRLSATASAGVERVAFFSEGGAYRIAEDRTPPFAIDWHTAGFVPDGAQRLSVMAFDRAGRSASRQIGVRVRNGSASVLPADDLARVTAYFEARRGARYLEGDCQSTTYPAWSGVPLRLCRYRVSDSYSGGTRQADVIVANPEPAQLARWVVQAALERRGRVQRSDTDAICQNIMGQSGGQFPVAGVVYEDMDGTGQRIYPFRNGVTVRIEGLPFATREQPNVTQMAAYRTGAVAYVGRYGRIAGTLPEHWTALTGESVAPDRSNWPDIVGRAHREAWGRDRNALIVAWARANL